MTVFITVYPENKEIAQYKNINIIPNKGDLINVNGKDYTVSTILYAYDINIVSIFVNKV